MADASAPPTAKVNNSGSKEKAEITKYKKLLLAVTWH